MTSPVVHAKRESVSERFPPFDDSVSLRLTPTPVGNYRCPVSTPANFVQCAGKIRRTKPLHDVIRSTQPSVPTNGRGKLHRSKLTALTRASRPEKIVPMSGRGIDYYFVDPQENKREEQLTNTHWLRALCAQPVDEILGKYRRRTQDGIIRTCSTPGERSLVSAWESNVIRSAKSTGRRQAGKKAVKSAMSGGIKNHKGAGHSASSTLANSFDRRTTKSEPPLSRAQQATESVEKYGLSPRTSAQHAQTNSGTSDGGEQGQDGSERKGNNRDGTGDNQGKSFISPDGPPKRVKGFLLDDAASEEGDGKEASPPPRYVSFTAQLFRHTDEKGNARTFSKITRGPEHLPYISNSKRVTSMVHNTNVYTKGPPCSSLSGKSEEDSKPADAEPARDSTCNVSQSSQSNGSGT